MKTFNNIPDNKLCLSTISNSLKGLSFSRKRTRKSAARRKIAINLEKRRQAARELISAIKLNLEVIFFDQTGFKITLAPLYGYSKVGERCIVSSNSVVAAITKEKIIGYQAFKGSVKTDDFGAF